MQTVFPGSLQWRKSTPMPEPRAGYASGILNGKLVIAGGNFWEGTPGDWKKKLFTGTSHIFDPETEKWHMIPALPVPMGHPASVVINSKLLVLGGFNGKTAARSIYSLQWVNNRYEWNVFGEIPADLVFARAEVVGNRLYLIGGTSKFEPLDAVGSCCTSSTATNTVFVRDFSNAHSEWTEVSPFPGPKRWLFSTVAQGKFIWLFGGSHLETLGDTRIRYKEVFRYNTEKDSWEEVTQMPDAIVASSPLTPVHSVGKIILVSFDKSVWEFLPDRSTFQEIAQLPEIAFVDSFFWINDRIVGAGGENKADSPRRRSEWTFIGQFVNP